MISEHIISQTVDKVFGGIEFTAEPAGLYDPLRYMIAIGGKRVRPRLCLTAYSLFKDEIAPEVLAPVSALEVFHTFTLIHDDIMDHSPLRRGQETVWKKWCEDTAILSGDVMLIDAYDRIALSPLNIRSKALALFSRTAAEVCEGQQYDMEFESRNDVSMPEYEKMIGLKTAVLLACSAKMGALLADADENSCDALYKYGYQLGMAFQVADDYLDVFGDEKVFGKPIGGDIIQQKKSWLTVHMIEKLSNDSSLRVSLDEFDTAMSLPIDTAEQKNLKIETVRNLYLKAGIDADAKREIFRYNQSAMESLTAMNLPEEGSFALKNFADKLVGRAK